MWRVSTRSHPPLSIPVKYGVRGSGTVRELGMALSVGDASPFENSRGKISPRCLLSVCRLSHPPALRAMPPGEMQRWRGAEQSCSLGFNGRGEVGTCYKVRLEL